MDPWRAVVIGPKVDVPLSFSGSFFFLFYFEGQWEGSHQKKLKAVILLRLLIAVVAVPTK